MRDLEACERFYVELLGMRVAWRPDPDNVYLTGGSDNQALHRSAGPPAEPVQQRLDHGFMLGKIGEVERWFEFLKANAVRIAREPRTHRDGERSFYCFDPDGNTVQIIYHPPLAAGD